METRDFDRIRFVTQRFNDLQGLRHLVPLGLVLSSGAGAAWLTGWPLVLLQAVLVSGAVLLLLGARRYYRRSFGEVERPRVEAVMEHYSLSINPAGPPSWLPDPAPGITGARRLMLILGLAPAAFLLFQLLFWPPWIALRSGVIVDPEWLPVLSPATLAVVTQMVYPLCGSFFLAVWWSRERRLSQSHHLAMGALLSGLAVSGPAHPGVALLLCGSAMVLAGLLDHWQLVRALGRPAASQEEE